MILPSRSYTLTAAVSKWTPVKVNDRFSIISTLIKSGAQKQPLLSSDNTVSIQSFITATFNAALFDDIQMSGNDKVEAVYPDLDAGTSGSTQPVTVGAEAEGIDGVTAVQGVKVLAFVQVPQHGLTILQSNHWNTSKMKLESVLFIVFYIFVNLINCQNTLPYQANPDKTLQRAAVGWPKQDRLNGPQTKQSLNVKFTCHN